MARTPSMTLEEAQAQLGARGRLNVDINNRGTVRKWLVANDFPSLFVGGLSMRELQNAYNDESGQGIDRLRKKLAETMEGAPEESIEEQARDETASQSMAREMDARREAAKASREATPEIAPDASDPAGATLAGLVAPHILGAIRRDMLAEIDARMSSIPTVRIEFARHDGGVAQCEGHSHPKFADLARAAASRYPDGYVPNIFLAGEASSGKTTACRKLAEAMGLSWHFNGAISMPHEMLGFIDAGGTYHRTPFRDAYENGGIYTFDEVDRSDPVALLAVNPHLANGLATFPDAQIKRHPECIIIGTANTWGLGADANYSGATKLDAAFLSRFPVRIAWDIDVALEIAISGNEQWARRVQGARERARAAGLKVLIDVRITQAGAALIAAGATMDQAAKETYLANLKPEQRRIVEGR